MYAYLKPNNKAMGCGDWIADHEEATSFAYTGLWKDGEVVALLVEGDADQLREIGEEIVTACNAHAGLVEALKSARQMLAAACGKDSVALVEIDAALVKAGAK